MATCKAGSDGPGRVHFPDDQLQKHDAEIVIQADEDGQQSVHLGFLQIQHRYQIRFSIKDKLGEDIVSDPLESLNVRVLEAVPSDDGEGHNLLIEFRAQKEKLMKEQLTLFDKQKANQLLLIFHARVLGKGKGTPALRHGIHCVGIDVDEESEGSDWQGFD